MAMTGRQIMEAAGILLQDARHVRWPLAELAVWINEGLRAIVLAKPSARAETISIELVEGTLQSVPNIGSPVPQRIMAITRNLPGSAPGGSSRAIRPTKRSLLDVQNPGWHGGPFAREVRHYIFDEENPLRFYVYPGNTGEGLIEGVVSVLPAELVPTGSGTDLAHWDVPLDINALYQGPLVDYVCFRAQLKDDLAANSGRAAVHYQQFATALGIKIQTERATSPNRERVT